MRRVVMSCLLVGWVGGCHSPPTTQAEPAQNESSERGPSPSAPFEAPSHPSSPVRILAQQGPPVWARTRDALEIRVRVTNHTGRNIERLGLVVHVLDASGALRQELRGAAPRDLQLLPARSTRTVPIVVSSVDPTRTGPLDHLVFSPRTADFCDGSTWMAELGRTIETGRAGRCPEEPDETETPGVSTQRPGRLVGPGYSILVPLGYAEDAGHPLYARGVRGMRKGGQPDRFISIAPAQPTVNSPGEWDNLEPQELDLARCRALLPTRADDTFSLERTESQDTRICVVRGERDIVRIIVTSHIDYRMLCWTGGDDDVVEACDAVAASWRTR